MKRENKPKKPKLFKKENTSLPSKRSKEVRTFLTAIRSAFLGSKFNKPHSNISKEETEALKTSLYPSKIIIRSSIPIYVTSFSMKIGHTRQDDIKV